MSCRIFPFSQSASQGCGDFVAIWRPSFSSSGLPDRHWFVLLPRGSERPYIVWDRLPMTLSFAAILAIVVEERVSASAGAILLLWPALAVGLFSLLLWRWSDDLRLYFWVQFFPGLAVVLLFLVCSPKYSGTHYWILAGVLYALAKVFEFT